MNPPLDSAPLHPPESAFPESDSFIVHPRTTTDLRGQRVTELHYPATAAVIFAGVPGAGKSTALRRLFGAAPESICPTPGPDHSIVLDSIQARNAWRHRMARLPYPLWRPMVHIVHFRRIRIALRDHNGPVVIHDCGTIGFTRYLLIRWAVRHGREPHMVLLDVAPAIARAGQYARGRQVGRLSFQWHTRRWRQLLDRATNGAGLPVRTASAVVLDRAGIGEVRAIRFVA